MHQEPPSDHDQFLAELSQLSQEYQGMVAPFQAQIKELEMARDTVTAALRFRMDTLETLLRPMIVAGKATKKVPYLTAVYVRRDKWNRDILFNIAQEVPAIMQAYEDASYVQFKKTSH